MIDDPRFAKNIDRVSNRDDLKMELESALMRIDGHEICEILAKTGLAVGPIHNTAQVVDHPHTHHRGMSIEQDWYKMWGSPIKLSRTPGGIRHLPPKFGAHTDEILEEFGFEPAEIEGLIRNKVLLKQRQE